MRLLEGYIFLFNIVFTVLIMKSGLIKSKYWKYISFINFDILIIHIIIEKARWQLFPLYLITILYFIYTILYMSGKFNLEIINYKQKKKRLLLGTMIFLIIISGISAYAFPVYKMPLPSGKYKIGTESFDLTDPVRKAIYSDNINENRKIKIQIWYPVDYTQGFEREPWLQDGKIVSKALAKEMSLPSFVLDHTALVMSNSFKKAPISNDLGKYPIVIISHGWTGFRNLHSDVAEELSSNGYIVIGIDHTYGSQITKFNDGKVAYLNREALPKREETPDFLEYANILVNTYEGDVNLTINQLEKFNNGEVYTNFKGKLDLSKIGLLGHSTGGGADVAVALKDERIKAVFGMDAWVEPIKKEELEKGLKIPALFLRSGNWEEGFNNNYLLPLIDRSKDFAKLYQINNTTHSDFTMVYMYSPLTKYLKITGKLDGKISSSIQRDFIKSFFDKNLKENNSIDIIKLMGKWKDVKNIK